MTGTYSGTEQLAAGDRWDETLRLSVKQSNIFVLFWCCDTGHSDYIAREIALALRLKKKIVPVKLCNAALPQPLSEWQWIDLQKRVEHECANLDHDIAQPLSTPSAPMAPRAVTAPKWVLGFATLVLMVSGAFWFTFDRSLPQEQGTHSLPSGGQASPLVQLPIPGGATRLPNGYATVSPPSHGDSGNITELDSRGHFVRRYAISPGVPAAPPPKLTPSPLPWWYVNRAVLAASAGFMVAVTFFAWILWTARRRAATTLNITRSYLERLANSAAR